MTWETFIKQQQINPNKNSESLWHLSHGPLPYAQLSLMAALLQECAAKNTGLSPPQILLQNYGFFPRGAGHQHSSSCPAQCCQRSIPSKNKQISWAPFTQTPLIGCRTTQVWLDDDTWPWSPLHSKGPRVQVQEKYKNKDCHHCQVPLSI